VWPWPLTFWPLNRFTDYWITCAKGFHHTNFGLPRPFRSRGRSRQATDRQTDRQTNTAAHFIMPLFHTGWGHNKCGARKMTDLTMTDHRNCGVWHWRTWLWRNKTQEWTLTDQVSVVGNDGPQSKTPSLLIKMYEKADKPVLNIGLLKVTTKKNRPTSRTIDINMKLSVQVTN